MPGLQLSCKRDQEKARENDPGSAKAKEQDEKHGAMHDGPDLSGNHGQSAAAHAKPVARVPHRVGKW